jgi:2-(1,2-epoxy-1,2-dihydrophenyl)acetyl-CoA isomerase
VSGADDPVAIDGLRYDVAGRIATITLDRPEALNSLTVPVKKALLAAFRRVRADDDVRVVVLTGTGRAFCAGQDLRERLEPDAEPLDVELRDRYNPLIRAMWTLEKPIVGAINGIAAGAGASLAFACDVRVAAEEASFLLAFGRVGLVPDSGATWLLPRLVGLATAMELALANEPLSAVDARRLGLVSRIVAGDQLATEARGVAERLAAGAPRALALTKRALHASLGSTLEEALEREAVLQGEAGASLDHTEGLNAFLEKRPPKFEGR